MIINAGVAIGLSMYIGYIAAAIATTLAGWVMVWLLWRGSQTMGDAARFDTRFKSRLWRIMLASVLMGVLLLNTVLLVGPWLGMETIRYGALAFVVIIGIIGYFVIGRLIGAFRVSEFKSAMRRN